jgi:hypothetical protein
VHLNAVDLKGFQVGVDGRKGLLVRKNITDLPAAPAKGVVMTAHVRVIMGPLRIYGQLVDLTEVPQGLKGLINSGERDGRVDLEDLMEDILRRRVFPVFPQEVENAQSLGCDFEASATKPLNHLVNIVHYQHRLNCPVPLTCDEPGIKFKKISRKSKQQFCI